MRSVSAQPFLWEPPRPEPQGGMSLVQKTSPVGQRNWEMGFRTDKAAQCEDEEPTKCRATEGDSRTAHTPCSTPWLFLNCAFRGRLPRTQGKETASERTQQRSQQPPTTRRHSRFQSSQVNSLPNKNQQSSEDNNVMSLYSISFTMMGT